MRTQTTDALTRVGLDPGAVEKIIRAALLEDLGPSGVDVTSVATIPADQMGAGDIVARAAGVVAGLPVAVAVYELASDGDVAVDLVV